MGGCAPLKLIVDAWWQRRSPKLRVPSVEKGEQPAGAPVRVAEGDMRFE
jgi:hypothetical protein